ncbi:MAG: hypothetical protein A2Z21_02140 [Candidatus Fraserbacteria bacterium RBG_16_55_9]|uniref:Uncharacterized protein n=1 Tax=Fraserbacteria sp. (strain RBG_16_55_9) TaxID=1817864 RepID=A0A1F5V1C3_FRAXR|nr:MAG: hypothetical protein A2Z21_02140 [Candidatus Fraserbacteria bacterium RBG_16_55_9]
MVKIPLDNLRDLFNQCDYYEMVLQRQLRHETITSNHADPPPYGDPWCTHSQTVAYFDHQGNFVAEVHQFLRPDGKLGASGLPDPKRLFYNGEIFWASH